MYHWSAHGLTVAAGGVARIPVVIRAATALVSFAIVVADAATGLDVEASVVLEDDSGGVTLVEPHRTGELRDTARLTVGPGGGGGGTNGGELRLAFVVSNAFSWLTDKSVSYDVVAYVPREGPTLLRTRRAAAAAAATAVLSTDAATRAAARIAEAGVAAEAATARIAAARQALADGEAALDAARSAGAVAEAEAALHSATAVAAAAAHRYNLLLAALCVGLNHHVGSPGPTPGVGSHTHGPHAAPPAPLIALLSPPEIVAAAATSPTLYTLFRRFLPYARRMHLAAGMTAALTGAPTEAQAGSVPPHTPPRSAAAADGAHGLVSPPPPSAVLHTPTIVVAPPAAAPPAP